MYNELLTKIMNETIVVINKCKISAYMAIFKMMIWY